MNYKISKFLNELKAILFGTKDSDVIERSSLKDYGIDMSESDEQENDCFECDDIINLADVAGNMEENEEKDKDEVGHDSFFKEKMPDLSVCDDKGLEKIEVDYAMNIEGGGSAKGQIVYDVKYSDMNDNKVRFKRIVDIINEFDNYKNRISSPDTCSVIDLMQHRLIDELVWMGCDLIDGDSNFDNERHIPVPLKVSENGATIKSFKKQGIIYGNEIILKALVTI